MRLIVCGGRDFLNRAVVFAGLDLVHEWIWPITHLIEGGQRTKHKGMTVGGADFWGNRWAAERDIRCTTVKADWSTWKGQAGPMRNAAMLRLKPQVVVGFPGGSGTENMLDLARRDGVTRIVFDESGRLVPQDMQGCK
ncbi:hypothetical protein ADL19_19280 [Streptomyces purpurogeneiscleroticus]|nr:hypothetical protein ADL19_19280 [Streptomyces purpurogeneiscleroticus]